MLAILTPTKNTEKFEKVINNLIQAPTMMKMAPQIILAFKPCLLSTTIDTKLKGMYIIPESRFAKLT